MTLTLAATKEEILSKIHSTGDTPYASATTQLDLVESLCQFDLGRYLLEHNDLNTYWMHYALTHPWFGRKTGMNNHDEALHPLEEFILNRAPLFIALQQRFEIFLKLSQAHVKNTATLACMPSGTMGELLYLDYTHIDNVRLIGMHTDFNAIKCAQALADAMELARFTNLLQMDCYQADFKLEFDLVLNHDFHFQQRNPLNRPAMYANLYQALKPGGTLLTSFMQSEWDMTEVNETDVQLQQTLLHDILGLEHFQTETSHEIQLQLETAGFTDIQFLYDSAKMIPSVIARKR